MSFLMILQTLVGEGKGNMNVSKDYILNGLMGNF